MTSRRRSALPDDLAREGAEARPQQGEARPQQGEARSNLGERQEGAWRVLPIEGAFELVYEDVGGARTRRRLIAQELKIGPGRVLLGGIDMARDGYRGFRADRIARLVDAETRVIVDRNIVDWLMKRAERTLRERKAELRQRKADLRRAA